MVEWSCYHDPLRLRLCFDDLSPRETTPSLVKGSPAVLSLYVCASLLLCLAVARRFRPSRRALRPPPCWGEGGAARPCESAARRRVFAPTKVLAFLSCVSLFSSVSSPCSPLLALALNCPPPCSLIPVSSVFPFPVVPRRSPSSLSYPWPRVFCLPFPRRSLSYPCQVEKCSLYVQAMC